MCATYLSFTMAHTRAMSAKTRGVWSTEYRVRWPCQDSDVSDCVRDYRSDICPVGWRRSGKDCVAPGSYVGCHSVQRTQRQARVESARGAHFPCASSSVIRESGRFLRNHDNPCAVSYIIFSGVKFVFKEHVVWMSYSIYVFRVG